MKKIISLICVVVALVLFTDCAKAQISTNGSSGLSATYPNLASAVTALNGATITAPVVISVNAGNPQTAPAGGYTITATGNVTNTITFTGNGNTITASASLTAGALNDGIFKLIGSDYVTIQGFTIQENPANITTAAASNNMTEWGVALLYNTITDGAKNNIIQNNTISLNRIYSNTFGIYSNVQHSPIAVTTPVNITLATGSNSGNKIYGNTISNVDYGIVFEGSYTAAAMDSGNDIGGSSLITSNTITNWGGLVSGSISGYVSVTTMCSGIYMDHQINDNVSFNSLSSATNITTITTVGFWGIYKNYSSGQPSGIFTSNYNNNTVTLNNTAATSSTMTGMGMQGLYTAVSTATFNCNNNNIINCSNTGASMTFGNITGMSHISSVGTFNISGNTIRGFTSQASSSGRFTGIELQSPGVVTALNITNNNIGDGIAGAVNFTAATHSGFTSGISIGSGAASTCALTVTGNNFQGITHTAATPSGPQTYISNTSNCLSQNISSNTFTNITAKTSSNITFISNNASTSAAGFKTINNNSIVTGFNKSIAGGSVTLYLDQGATLSNTPSQYINNNFSNITVTGATSISGWQNNDGNGSLPQKIVTGNTFSNWTCGSSSVLVLQCRNGGNTDISSNTISNISGTGTITGITQANGSIPLFSIANNNITGLSGGSTVTAINNAATPVTANINNNTINNISSTSLTANVTGVTSSTGTILNIFSNVISTLSCVGTTSGVTSGISISGGTTINIYKNKIFDLNTSGAFTTTPGVNGISISTVVTANAYNNLIGDLRAAASTSTDAVRGLSVTSIFAFTTYNLSYNAVYLSGTGGATFGNTGIFHDTSSVVTTGSLVLRNNNIVNLSTPAGGGLCVAYRRKSTNLANYLSSSNFNNFYGTSGLFTDGTNTYTTLAAYKTAMSTRDVNSINENPAFQSTTGSNPNFLKYDVSIATQLESGGVPLSGIADDITGTARNVTNPDIGAWELSGVVLDASGPVITYTPFPNSLANTNQVLNATITDMSGIGSGAGLPKLYYKSTTSIPTFTAVTGVNTSGSTYTFTFGSAVTNAGETVFYYIVAQDAASTPNVSCSPVAGATGFSANPPAVSTPPTSPNTYLAGASMAGIYTVGTGGTYPNLTGASGLFNAINTSVVTGNIYVSVRSNLVETGTVSLNQFAAPYTFQIRPSGSVTTRIIEGTTVGTVLPMIDVNGADRVSFNGADSATNTGQYFRVVNNNVTTANTGSVFRFINDAKQDSVRNCILESNASTSACPIVLISTTTVNSSGNDSITVDKCLFRQSAGTNPGRYSVAFTSSGSGSFALSNSDNNLINCNFTGLLATSTNVISIAGSGNGYNWTISNNKIYNDVNFTGGQSVIALGGSSMNNVTVSGNSIGGSAPDRSGSFYGSTINTITAISMSVGSTIASNVQGNIIANFGSAGGQVFGITVSGKVNIGTIVGNTIGGLANPWDTCRAESDNSWITYNGGDTARIENNLVGNCAYYSNTNSSSNIGITASGGVNIIKNNTVRDIKGNCRDVTVSNYTVKGIYIKSSTPGQIVEGNTVYNIQNTWAGFNPATVGVFTSAIQYDGTGFGTIERNRIYNVSSVGTGTGDNAPRNIGIFIATNAKLDIINNQISLTASTLEPLLQGINSQYSDAPITLLYNTIYIGGVCAGTLNNSHCYFRKGPSVNIIRNNIFFNQRTGGVNNYCIGVTSSSGWTSGSANYNAYFPLSANQVGVIGSFTQQTFANWKTNAGSDKSSVSATGVSSTNLFTSTATGNLNIIAANAESWNVAGLGTPVTTPSVLNDYGTSSTVRSVTFAGGVTDIGSDEFTPGAAPSPVTQSGPPANNTTTTYTYNGRVLGSLDWGAGGTVPTGITFTYFPGVNPPGSIGFPVANGYWLINATGGSGFSYNITINYDDAIIGEITSEEDIRLSKSEDGGATWNTFSVTGTAAGQYELDLPNNTIKVYGLTSFSTFCLTDADLPLPVELSSFTSFIDKRNVTLKWSTISEQNNAGFDIERKESSSVNNWNKVGNVPGAGTSSSARNYSFTENNLNTGKYNYRLKQIDFNGNIKYYELAEEVEISIPNKYEISQNYPNPFNPTTKINYDLPFDSKVQIKIFDMTGREVYQLVNQVQSAGYYTSQFNASALASGVYFYQINATGGKQTFVKTMKMVLVK